jgi:ABC-type lipoprotein release transport system permease subunit
VAREQAEEELFGGGNAVAGEAVQGELELDEDDAGMGKKLLREDLVQRVYSQQEIDRGMVLNAALFLEDPSKAAAVIDDINARSEAQGLGLRAVSWQQASGLIGQLVLFARGVLYLALVIFFVIALVVINNAMMMATLQRVREIGTMRAIGAQRGFVLSMVLLETLALGVVFGAMGAGLGSALVTWLGRVGIPARNDQLYFFFSGPRLLPSVSLGNVVAAFLAVLAVSAISTLYPALVATRVSPVKAMGQDE